MSRMMTGVTAPKDTVQRGSKLLPEINASQATLEAKSNINPNASVGAPNPGTNGTHTKMLDFDSKGT